MIFNNETELLAYKKANTVNADNKFRGRQMNCFCRLRGDMLTPIGDVEVYSKSNAPLTDEECIAAAKNNTLYWREGTYTSSQNQSTEKEEKVILLCHGVVTIQEIIESLTSGIENQTAKSSTEGFLNCHYNISRQRGMTDQEAIKHAIVMLELYGKFDYQKNIYYMSR